MDLRQIHKEDVFGPSLGRVGEGHQGEEKRKIAESRTCSTSREEFECQGQRSSSPGTKTRLALPSPHGSVRMVCARCKQRAAAAADGTIPSLPG